MRTALGITLVFVAGLVVGCGAEPSPAGPTTPDAQPSKPTDPNPSPDQQPPTPPEPPKPSIPDTPVAGKLAGEPFTPEVQLQGAALRFRVMTDGYAERQIELRFLLPPDKPLAGTKWSVTPDQQVGPDTPVILITRPELPEAQFLDTGYTMTLELGERAGEAVPGKILLDLPGDEETTLAGTFTAEVIRTPDEPPGPADAPYITGTITAAGGATPHVRVGYLRVDPHDPEQPAVVDLIGTELKPGGFPLRTEVNRPRVVALIPPPDDKTPGRYEFVKLEPGKYWVFAAVEGGPAVWEWVTVGEKSEGTANLQLDPEKYGGLAITAPGSAETVAALPATPEGEPWPELLVGTAASMLGTQVETPKAEKEPENVSVTFPRLAPGKYTVWAGDKSGTAEVKAGETAKLDLTAKKEKE